MAEEVFIFPSSFAQQRLWFLDQLEPNSAYYNIPLAVRLHGPVNVPVLEQSLNEVVRRHETLRTRFKMIDGQPMQVIAPSIALEMPVRDLRGMPEEEAIRLATEEARKPFDLKVAPLLRALLLRVRDDEYVLTLTLHHIVGDGWSLGILIRELTSLYEAFTTGKPSPLPELPIQYADFADWEQQWLQGELLDEQLSYWEGKLAGDLPVLELPTDHPRPRVPAHRGSHFYFTLPLDLTEKLKTLARSEEVTLFMALLAGFKVILNRYTGQHDIPVGVPNANRNQIETEGLIGFFVNTLVMRTDVSGQPSFRKLLRRVRETVLEADAHREVPFEKLVERLQPERNLAQNPLFQVMFQFQNDQTAPLTLPEVTLSFLELESGTAKFDLILSLRETPEGLSGSAQYDTELFERETIERMMGHYRNLLETIAANPEQQVSRLPLLSAAERQQLVGWNDTNDEVPQQCLHDLFAAQVEKTPEALAVISGEQSWTYRELNRRANQVANYLRKLGVGPDDRVGLCLEPSLEMAAGVLGVMKAGSAYVPLDPAYPQERIALMVRDAMAKAVLTQSWLVEGLPHGITNVECLDQTWDAPGPDSEAPVVSSVQPENLAYVIYTSGSTGVPKGVAMTHEAIVNLMWWQIREPGFAAAARTAQFHSFSFDVSCQEMFSTWASGGTLVLLAEEERRDANRLIDRLSETQVERLFLAPVALQQLAEASQDQTPPKSLREIIVAGEQLQVGEATARMFEKLDNCVLYNQYGPTESHVVTAFTLPTSPVDWTSTPPIGKPVANTQIHLLDQQLQLVPVGVPGHLYIGGLALARGYLGRPQLTAERFIPDPLSTKPGARLYMTGDLARYLADGNIEFLGRVDHQVKIRGFRIEPAEVEAVLRRNPAVQDAVVVVRELSPGDKRLVAYLVANPDSAPPSTSELHQFVGESLPRYMVPSAFVFLDALPLTPSGKVDRRSLPAPGERVEEREERELSPVEEVVAGTWCEVLGVSRVGVDEDFFELGGHSLLATRVVSRLRDVFNVELPVRRMFETPTVAGLATGIELANGNGRMLQMPPLEPAARPSEIPLSFAQQRLWFLDQLEPGNPFYNLSNALRIDGPLNVDALEQAFNEVVRRHESLRTTFAAIEGRPFQIISPERTQRLPLSDLCELPQAEREAAAQRLASEESLLPFDLSSGSLLRARLLRMDVDHHVLLLTMHHIITDGWSKGVLMKELAALYEAYTANQPSPLSDLRIQYADFSYAQREWLQGNTLEQHLEYWKQQLAGALTVLELPTDLPRPAFQTFRGANYKFDLPADLSDELKKLSRREGSTLFMTLLSAFSMLLSRYTRQEDLIVGTAIANREQAATEDLIGMFVNTLPIRVDLSGILDFTGLLGRVRETALGAYTHQSLPFEKLIDEIELKRETSRSPLVQVMLILQNAPVNTIELPGLTLTSVAGESRTSKLDLTLSITEDAGTLRCLLEYNTDLFKAATIERLAGHFRTIVAGVVADPHRRLWEYPMLSATEHGQLSEWNVTSKQYDKQHHCLHELFEVQVERTPEATAVTFESEQLSYRELDERANQLARHLRALNVGPEVSVGILMDRSLEMAIALLAVLKAGGAYVPLDPDYPAKRLSYLIKDSRIPVVLTQQPVRARLGTVLSDFDGTVVAVDAEWPTIARQSRERLARSATSENLVYVIYTSGSTGQPKGAMLNHRGIVNCVLWMQETYQLDDSDSFLLKTSLNFDPSVWELFWPLSVGASVVIARPGEQADTDYLLELINKYQITSAYFVPSMLRLFLEDPRAGNATSLKRVICGGEKLPVETIAFFFDTLRAELHHSYGPTETSIAATEWQCDRTQPDRVVSIGRPLANTEVHILDPNMQFVPVGIAGELYIGGVCLGRGYMHRPDLTAEKFVPHPFSAEPGTPLYRTGDLVRYLENGEVEFLGRVDQQVKMRGYRIELGEIEAALRRHPLVSDCLVLMRGETSASKQLIAYVVAPGMEVSELRRHLKEQLPVYMIPSAFVLMEALPLMPNGKVDRRALPAPEAVQVESSAAYVAPGTMTEQIIADIWQELLKVERAGVQDDFFELGGHSLLATQLISRVRATLQVEVALRELFAHPTLAEFANVVDDARRMAGGVELPPIRSVGRDGTLSLSFAQQRLWFLDQLQPGSTLFNSSGHLRLSGELDLAALETTVTEIVRRHETLRTTFTAVDGQPMLVIHPPQPVQISVIYLTGIAECKREAEARRLMVEESQQPFDLDAGPLFRVTLFRLNAHNHLLLYTLHHIISDGWSIGVLIREVAALYTSLINSEPSPLPDLPLQYADFAAWQRDWLEGGVLEKQLVYWKQRLTGAPSVLELPLDHARPPLLSERGSYLKTEIPSPLTAALKKLSKQEGVTLFMTLLSAWQTLLMRYSREEDILVGTTIANRQHRETEQLIGFFANTLVLRTDLSGDPTFRELLVRVKEVALEAYAQQDLPFEKLVEELQPVRSMSHAPLFQVMFGLENVPRESLQLPNLQLTPLEWTDDTVKADLTLGMQEREDVIGGVLGFNTDIFERATMARLLDHFQTLLSAIVANPEQRLSELSFLTEAERYYLTETVNATAKNFPTDVMVHQLFAQQAERSPNATALSAGGIDFSYAELNEKSNRLAHALIERGAGREQIVAVCLERSPESAIALLAIWKAGAAYLPLDVEQPVQRLQMMLADATPSIVITTSEVRYRLDLSESTPLLCLDEEEELLDRQPGSAPDREVQPDDLAYVIYTSGSTGTPKGVLVEHQQLLNTLLAAQEQYQFTSRDVMPFFFTFAFDISLYELLAPMLAGGRVLMLSGREMLEEQVALAALKQVTFVHSAPGLMRQMVALMSLSPVGTYAQVRSVMVGGDAVSPELLDELRAVLPQANLYVGYGPTEAAIMCASYDLGAASNARVVEHNMIGHPMLNTAFRLYDSAGQLVPLGVAGELYIGGASVSRGYLNRPDLTAEKFVELDGQRWYRSGDLGRRLSDGSIAFAGRADRQVKLRGYRIELGEIETALTEHAQVHDAVVTLREDVPGDQRLVAYLVPRRNHLSEMTKQSLYQLPNGVEIAHLNENDTEQLYEDIFGQEIYLRYDITLRDGDCVFDVSANIGMFTLFVNDMCREATVYAFEPAPASFAALQYNVAAYNLNVKSYNFSFSELNGNAHFDLKPMAVASSATYSASIPIESHIETRASSKTLSEVIAENQIEQIDLLKLDIEKSGLDVLRGIAPDDWSRIKQIVSAVHDREGSLEQFSNLLKTHGFEVTTDQVASYEHPDLHYVYAVHQSKYESDTVASRNYSAGSYLSQRTLSVSGLQSYLKAKLPEYMVPSAFVTLDALPTLPTGKVDRKALPAPDTTRPELDDAYIAPRNSIEERIAKVWVELLGVERVGVHDNFFELGGHSLLATTAITRLQEEFNVEISLRSFFEHPTLAGIAVSIVEGLADPLDEDQMSEILAQLENLPAE